MRHAVPRSRVFPPSTRSSLRSFQVHGGLEGERANERTNERTNIKEMQPILPPGSLRSLAGSVLTSTCTSRSRISRARIELSRMSTRLMHSRPSSQNEHRDATIFRTHDRHAVRVLVESLSTPCRSVEMLLHTKVTTQTYARPP